MSDLDTRPQDRLHTARRRFAALGTRVGFARATLAHAITARDGDHYSLQALRDYLSGLMRERQAAFMWVRAWDEKMRELQL